MIQPIPNNPLEGKIKAILNGGKNELDCAIVPFTFGLNEEIINRKPTHVLIIDRTYKEADTEGLWKSESNYTHRGRRYFIDLSKPADHFIEFFKSGEHNLLFIFFSLPKESFSKKSLSMFEDSYLKKQTYDKHLYDKYIRVYNMTSNREDMVGFCEKDVYIPYEFFSQAPQSMFGKMFYDWVNKWRREKPVDDCDFRDRVWRALTYELIPRIGHFLIFVLGYFLLRVLFAILASATSLVLKTTFFICGVQNKNFTKGFVDVWKKYVLLNGYTLEDAIKCFDLFHENNTNNMSGVYTDATYPYKEVHVFGKTFNSPISIIGAAWLFAILTGLSHAFVHFSSHVTLILSYLMILTIQIPLIVESSKFVDKLRNTKLFELKFIFDRDPDKRNDEQTKYDWFVRGSFIAFLSFFVMLIIYNLFAFGIMQAIGHAFVVVFTTKITLIIVGVIVLAVLAGFYGKKGVKAFGKFVVKLITILFRGIKIVLKPIDAFLYKVWMKLDAHLQKRFPPAPVIEKKTSGDAYKDWLNNSYNFDRTPNTITASTLPKAQTTKGRVVQTFKAKFWDTKSKICKPYEL